MLLLVLFQIEKYDFDYHEISSNTLVLTDHVLEQADEKRVDKKVNHLEQTVATLSSSIPPFLPPPPPPPLPQTPSFQSASTERKRDNTGEHKRIIWMKKYLY